MLAVLVVAGGSIDAAVRVADGVSSSRVEFRGTLDIGSVRRAFDPVAATTAGDALPAIKRTGYGYVSSAKATVTKPKAGADVLVLWAAKELAPWVLAALVLALVLPVLRAARDGDPFSGRPGRRLGLIGALLLAGIPAIALLGYVAAWDASEGNFVSPEVTPSLTVSVLHFLPGVVALTLAKVFERGAALRDFDARAI